VQAGWVSVQAVAYFHSVLKYGIILWGIPLIFRLQKRVARIIMGVGTRVSGTEFLKGPYYMGVKLFNGLPPQIKDLTNNVKQFESALLGFLHQHTFYTIDEYFNHQHK